jgi:hypothetical protein
MSLLEKGLEDIFGAGREGFSVLRDKTLCDYIDGDPSSGQIVSSFVLSSE